MSGFDESRWSEREFSQEYRDNANGYIPDRGRMIAITLSFYRQFVKGDRHNRAIRVLDLGCGDGLFVHTLWQADAGLEATLVDASGDMLEAARQRLAGLEKKQFVQASFQDLVSGDRLKTSFDFVLSSLAIHHLRQDEKAALFEYIYTHLNPGGAFLNVDVVLSPSDDLERWYLALWYDWIASHSNPDLLGVPQRYKENPDNVPDTLMTQLQALEKTGFRQVDCYYKFGIYVMFGGRK
jgi:tRNA (cmo5U34)-methyltransferase